MTSTKMMSVRQHSHASFTGFTFDGLECMGGILGLDRYRANTNGYPCRMSADGPYIRFKCRDIFNTSETDEFWLNK